MKKLWVIALITAMLLVTACANVTYDEEFTDTPPQNSGDIYEQLENSLPTLDYSDESGEDAPILPEREFTVFTDEPTAFVSSETDAGVINGVVGKRNDFLLEKYGALVVSKQVDPKKVSSELKAAIESGAEYCDMLAISGKISANLALSGLLTDFNTLPGFDAKSSYFDSANATELATNSTMYLLPDVTALYYEDTYAMFYNRNLLKNAGCEDPEALVMKGQWTWDKFLEMSKAASEVYDKSISDIENDIFAYAAFAEKYDDSKMNTTYPLVMWASAGYKIIGDSYKNPVGYSASAQELEDNAKGLKKYFDTKGRYPFEGDTAIKSFEKGKLVFFCNTLSYIHNLRSTSNANKGTQYGFLPLPKKNAEQERYYCLTDADARVLSVPATVADNSENSRKFVSYVISAQCAIGRETVEDAFVANYITDFFHNNSEAYMFKTICASATFDFGNVFDSVHRHFRKGSTSAIREYFEFGSDFSNSINLAVKNFEDFNAKNFT